MTPASAAVLTMARPTRRMESDKRYKFQINKNADNPTLRQFANQDSHRVWAQADLEIGATPDKEAVEKLYGRWQLERVPCQCDSGLLFFPCVLPCDGSCRNRNSSDYTHKQSCL
ncbi:hypothetical protein I7I48_07205 [Histoplasma ohiense]|nr:hypothetical protein I7I48_07205 [Histoplasma ohiense (nom. inval.)]